MAMNEADLVVRNGTIVDGSGAAPYKADVAIADGKIVSIGENVPAGRENIDAQGLLVTPGFIDIHTHYDAQVTWQSHVTPSTWNGVTTAVIGNCGVGFAPCRPEQREILIKLMEGVEDLPELVLTAGLPWEWESFPQFLDFLDGRQFDLDVVTQVPHAALRVYTMGVRATQYEPATEADCYAMAELAADAVRAGAIGFSTSRTLAHKTKDGQPTPTLHAEELELTAIAAATGQAGAAWMQVISDFDDIETEFAMLRRVTQKLDKPMSIAILQRDWKPNEWRRLLDLLAKANLAGNRMLGQTMGRPVGLLLGFELTQNPFFGRPSWDAIAELPLDEKVARLREPEFRAKLLAEPTPASLLNQLTNWAKIFPMTVPLNYEPAPDASIAAIAARKGVDPAELAFDLLLENEGRAILNRPMTNYAYDSLDAVYDMMRDDNTILGLGDGGAHVGLICDASAPTTTLSHWTRDRTRGPKTELAWTVKRLTRDCADAIGLKDRGMVALGYKADLNIIDYQRLSVALPEMIYDMPGGGRRLVQRAEGYVATILSGVVVARNGAATGHLPGRLVRGSRSAPKSSGPTLAA